MNPSSRGDGLDVAATDVCLRLLGGRDHSTSFSSSRVLAEEGEVIMSAKYHHIFSICRGDVVRNRFLRLAPDLSQLFCSLRIHVYTNVRRQIVN